MLSATFSVVGLGLVAGTGFATARALGATAFTELVLSAYTIGSAVVLGLVLVLSAFDAVSRTALFAGAATALVVTILFPRRRRCRAPRDRTRRLLADVWNEPPLLVLAIAVGGALIYVLALGLGTAPNTWDSLTYHLARVGFWLQERSIGYVANPYDGRLNGNPPGAEIGVAYLLGLGHSDLLAGIVQFLAALACAVGVYGIARRLGLTATEGAFGGLLFLTLPIVLLQASTTQNDVVVASFLVAATYFLLGDQRREHIVAALAIGMAVSTKLTAIYALPFMAVIGLIARPRTHRVRRMLAVAAGVAAGAWWYVINVVETGHVLGDLPDRSGTTTLLRFKTNLDTLYKFGLDSIDFSGARGADMLLYAGAAAVAGLSVTLGRTAGAIRRPWRAVSTAVLALSPFVLLPASFALWHGYVVLFEARDASWSVPTLASDSFSWFGPLGVLAVVGAAGGAIRMVRAFLLDPVALVLVLAPAAWLIMLAFTITYDPWRGRFVIFPVALSAALWGLALRRRPVAAAAAAVAATTALLSLVNSYEKPSGLRLLQSNPPQSIWSLDRWQVQTTVRTEMAPVLRFLEENVPQSASVALAIGQDDFGYPAFGSHLSRMVVLVPEPSTSTFSAARWLIANPARVGSVSRECWRQQLETEDQWAVFASKGSCETTPASP